MGKKHRFLLYYKYTLTLRRRRHSSFVIRQSSRFVRHLTTSPPGYKRAFIFLSVQDRAGVIASQSVVVDVSSETRLRLRTAGCRTVGQGLTYFFNSPLEA